MFWTGLIVGMFIGSVLGFVIAGILSSSKDIERGYDDGPYRR